MIVPTTLRKLRDRRAEILSVAARYGVEDIRVFGSALHGSATSDSDIDLLASFPSGTSLLDQMGFQQDLEDLLGRSVDVVSEGALHWFIRKKILEEAVPL